MMTDKGQSEVPRKPAAAVTAWLFFCCLNLFSAAPAQAIDASTIIKAAIDHWRGASSHSIMEMTVHRPGW